MSHVLVFGAGRVARPCVQTLLKDPEVRVTVVDMDAKNLDRVVAGHPRGAAIVANAADEARELIARVNPDLVINLLPPAFMFPVAQLCVEAKKHMAEVTTKRGGFYVLNHGFRPAPDVGAYVRDAQSQADSAVLRNADVELVVPAALDILFFGFQFGNDTTSASY